MATALLSLLNIDVPIVLAPMGGVVGPELCAAVSNAGGLGLIPLWRATPSSVAETIATVRERTNKSFGLNLNNNYPQDEQLAAAIDAGAPIVSFFWGLDPRHVSRAKVAGLTVIQTVGTATEARQAADAGVDVIVAQGWEAGGHVASTIATLALVPSVVDAVPGTPVLGAGGIADGRGLAAVMALGAAGAWIGTRFIMADEASGPQVNRDVLLAATDEDTTMGKDPNETWRDSAIRWVGPPSARWAYDYWPSGGQLAGQGVGLLKRQQSAAEIVSEIWGEAKATIRSLQNLT